jgi:hypothetical protein
VGETLDETRLEVQAKRAELEGQAADLEARVRHALDLKARFKENPALFVGVGAGAVFLVAGGPVRVARMLRRRMRPTPTEQTYDALPKPMQEWVDTLAAEVGPKAAKARTALVEELHRWRNAPFKDKKARKELAKAMVEGPPGPARAGWKAAEAALMLVSAALAKKAIEAFITGESPLPRDATRMAATKSAAMRAPAKPSDPSVEYSGFSGRNR